jgi:general secretion pathway protein G
MATETNLNVVRIRRALQRSASRGVTLVEVLIVLAIMALITGTGVTVVFPLYLKSQVKAARETGHAIRSMAKLHVEIDGNTESCPTVQELVKAKKLEPGKTNDPWGKPYKVLCEESDIRVVSSGKDGKEGSADDVRDNVTDKEIDAILDKM